MCRSTMLKGMMFGSVEHFSQFGMADTWLWPLIFANVTSWPHLFLYVYISKSASVVLPVKSTLVLSPNAYLRAKTRERERETRRERQGNRETGRRDRGSEGNERGKIKREERSKNALAIDYKKGTGERAGKRGGRKSQPD